MKLPTDSPYGLAGITLGIHGVTIENQVLFAPYYNLDGANLCRRFRTAFWCPGIYGNEANLSAIGEKPSNMTILILQI